ncbi:hypothetical protein SAMN02745172_03079 [Pseudoxanthobacter soli DSM 19599]|uniref:Uncharacterized protein n=1 Tax=Pseudoxanthobacter soli DSM 19599 TaxID=1123029 RepID=A0A1M7ZND5_9HYPH|nr:hypothetical protein [Pseudoxanthobacter soli]SHO66420.1 hypothetical protein SAMN02745172_03079 [Pseudoxanthobacter soli DSM 19599]
MHRTRLLWILAAAVIVAIAVYAFSASDPDRPGQPPPHAIDQSD